MLTIFKKLYNKFVADESAILPPGETEFDYIPLEPKKQYKIETKIVKPKKQQSKVTSLEEEIW